MKFSRRLVAYQYLPGLTIRHQSYSSSSSSSGNYYETLGLQKDCSRKEIRAAFLAKSKEFHPDSSQRDDLTGEQLKVKFQEVNEAYRVLNDPTERRVYDESLQYPKAGFSSRSGRWYGSGNYSNYQQYRAHQEFMRQQHSSWSQFYREQHKRQHETIWESLFRWRIGQPLTIMHLLLCLFVLTTFLEVMHSFYIFNHISARKQERKIYGSDWFNRSPFSEEEADKMLNELEKKSAHIKRYLENPTK